jgi:hypothetical protein
MYLWLLRSRCHLHVTCVTYSPCIESSHQDTETTGCSWKLNARLILDEPMTRCQTTHSPITRFACQRLLASTYGLSLWFCLSFGKDACAAAALQHCVSAWTTVLCSDETRNHPDFPCTIVENPRRESCRAPNTRAQTRDGSRGSIG